MPKIDEQKITCYSCGYTIYCNPRFRDTAEIGAPPCPATGGKHGWVTWYGQRDKDGVMRWAQNDCGPFR